MNPSDPMGRSAGKGAMFARLCPRVFSKTDSVSLLRALVEFSSLKKNLVVYDGDDEYEFVRTRLECTPSKEKVMQKRFDLKKLYRSNLRKGAAASGRLTGDDAVIFELSAKLWGGEMMQPVKEKERERERSARAVNLEESRFESGQSDRGGDVRAESASFRTEDGNSSGMVPGKGEKRKRKDGTGKIGGMAKPNAKSGSEDGEESARNVLRKKEKKHKEDSADVSTKRPRSLEEGPGGKTLGKGNGDLAKAGDLRAKSGPADGSSASYELANGKKHRRVERSRELEHLSEGGSCNDNDGSARSAEQSADSQLNRGKSSRKKKKKKKGSGDERSNAEDDGSVKSAKGSVRG